MNAMTSRRKVLLGLAAASTAAAGAAGAGTRQGATEAPELVELGNSLPAVSERYSRARAQVLRIEAEVAPIWPEAPEEIRYYLADSKPEQDISGRGIKRQWGKNPDLMRVHSYGTPDSFELEIAKRKAKIAHIMTTKSKRGLKFETLWLERMEAALPVSRAYVAEIERITEASGFPAAKSAEGAALADLKSHVQAIMDIDPKSMDGVVIQAEALRAWGHVAPIAQHFDLDAMHWPGRLAGAILDKAATA